MNQNIPALSVDSRPKPRNRFFAVLGLAVAAFVLTMANHAATTTHPAASSKDGKAAAPTSRPTKPTTSRPSRPPEDITAEIRMLQAARTKAKAQHTLIFLEMSAVWCGPCQKVKKQILPDPQVQKAMKKYVPVFFDFDQHKYIKNRFHISGIPTCILLNPQTDNLTTVNRISGILTKEQVLKFLLRGDKE